MLLLAVVLAAVMFVCPLAIDFPLLDPDEGLHASIAQEMIERDQWITPTFLGQPFLDKPIFYFWAQIVSLRLFGHCEAAVRLPGLMFGLLGAITTGLLGWRLFGPSGTGPFFGGRSCLASGRKAENMDLSPSPAQMGLIAGILYATMILPTALAQAASHDVALIPWINLALLALWESQRAAASSATGVASYRIGVASDSVFPRNNSRELTAPRLTAAGWTVAAGVFLGLAVLAKGLVGVAVVGVAYGSYLLIARQLNIAACIRGAAVLLIAALTASAWYLAVEMQNPGYLRHFFVQRHLLGFATGTQPHGGQPWWYYLPILLGGGLPWIGYLPVVVQNVRKSQPSILLWCWLIGWTLLLTLAGSKLATYLWPVFPAVALLAAVAWAGWLSGTLSDAARRSFARTFVWSSWSGPIVLPAAVLAVQWVYALQLPWPAWVATGVAAAMAPLPLIPWYLGRRQAAFTAATLSMAVQFLAVMAVVLPPVAATFSARDLADHFNRLGRLPPRLLVAEERIGSFVFYLDPGLRAGLNEGQLRRVMPDEPLDLRPGDVIALPERKLSEARGYLDLNGVPYEMIGHHRLYHWRETR
jgi:4-amino-4-deoxy-L-arabinose transferase-like glycosyltransferase